MPAENSHIYFNQTKEKDVYHFDVYNNNYFIYTYENNYYLYRSTVALNIAPI